MTEADTSWLKGRPEESSLSDEVVLRRSRPIHAVALANAVNESLEHLRPWMPWARGLVTADEEEALLREMEGRFEAGTDFVFLIFSQEDEVVGACGLHPRRGPGVVEIGYWVHVGRTGRGYATMAAARLVTEAFRRLLVERVEIRCDEANVASAAVPRRLGFKLTQAEPREPATPAETGREMVWVLTREDFERS